PPPTSAASSAQETATRSRFIKSLEQGKECRRTMENAQSRASRSEYRQKLQKRKSLADAIFGIAPQLSKSEYLFISELL
ncbi:hypothetical protein, partial [Pseudomonas aeruginosa]|uniref:hypothetical protein n=1 Tax=Pseudomonas aeruginosa TaxID=287 RepID=UPI001A9D6025